MFLFVCVLVFIINDCLQAQLCRWIRLCLSQFRKCTTKLLVWTGFPRWVLSFFANSHEIVPVLATTLLSKEIQLLLSTFFQPVAFKGSVWLIWEGTITVPKAQGGVTPVLVLLWSNVTELQAPSVIFHVSSLPGLQLKLFQWITVIWTFYSYASFCSILHLSAQCVLLSAVQIHLICVLWAQI